MKGQVNLDFLMKFFISVVAVLLIVLSLYYFGADFAKFLGVDFKLKAPGVTGGNLDKFELKAKLVNWKELTYDTCLKTCKILGADSCNERCSSVCNETGYCSLYNVSVYYFVPSKATCPIELSLLKTAVKPILNPNVDLLPGKNTFNSYFMLPLVKNYDLNATIVSSYGGNKLSSKNITISGTCFSTDSFCEYSWECCDFLTNSSSEEFDLSDSTLSKETTLDYKIISASISADLNIPGGTKDYIKLDVDCGNTYEFKIKNNTYFSKSFKCNSNKIKYKVIDYQNTKFDLKVFSLLRSGFYFMPSDCIESRCKPNSNLINCGIHLNNQVFDKTVDNLPNSNEISIDVYGVTEDGSDAPLTIVFRNATNIVDSIQYTLSSESPYATVHKIDKNFTSVEFAIGSDTNFNFCLNYSTRYVPKHNKDPFANCDYYLTPNNKDVTITYSKEIPKSLGWSAIGNFTSSKTMKLYVNLTEGSSTKSYGYNLENMTEHSEKYKNIKEGIEKVKIYVKPSSNNKFKICLNIDAGDFEEVT